jgi:integrase
MMGSIFRKAVTKPMPSGAESIVRQGVRLARWRDGKGKVRTAPITSGRAGVDRIRIESRTYYARYRDGAGMVVEAPTGCRDESAARQVLSALERSAERVRAGLLTTDEARASAHLATPIGPHVAAYLTALEAGGACPKHVAETRRVLNRTLVGCEFGRLADLDRAAVERWLNQRRIQGASGRTRNIDLTRLSAFANWCVADGRLIANPFRDVARANESETRRRRRALTADELARLLDVARRRPLLDALTVRKGPRKGERYADVRPEVRARLAALGRERALIYKTLVLTGLRRGELASLSVAQLRLDGPVAHVELEAADEKNREGNGVVIRADLADDLRRWLDDRLAALQVEARGRGGPIPARLPADAPVFTVPEALVKILDRDLRMAGIPKRDDRGRVVDVHAMRTTFGTLLSKGGVPLRTAQAAMRHADPSLTANVYTDPRLLDVAGAVAALPDLPLDSGPDAAAESLRATGSDAGGTSRFAPEFALTSGKPMQPATIGDKTNSPDLAGAGAERYAASVEPDRVRDVATIPDNPEGEWAMQGSNLRPPACRAGALAN